MTSAEKRLNLRNPSVRETEYYNERYSAGVGFRSRSGRYRQFLKPLHIKRGGYLLEIGCGEGHLLRIAQERDLFCYGIDISEEAVRLSLRQRLDHSFCKVLVADGHALPFQDGIFDYVMAIGTLEHFSDPREGIREIIRVCRDEGKMCFVVPNSFGPLRKLGIYRGTEQAQEKLATLSEWRQFLEENGMQIIYVGRDRGPDIFKNIRLRKIIQRLLLRMTVFMPLFMAYQFIFVCRKGKDNWSKTLDEE